MSLMDEARAVRENAHAPYSKFKVGAAVRTASGKVYVCLLYTSDAADE